MRLVLILVLILALIGVVGHYRGWFEFSSSGKDKRPGIAVSVDEDKIRQDKDKAVAKVESLGQKAKHIGTTQKAAE